MNAPNSSAQARAWRRRTAAVFAAVGALVFSSGLVMITAPAANAASVGICHATGSDTNPYNFISVDNSSTGYQGHLDHADTPQFTWNKGAWWNGTWYPAGTSKPDLISGVTFNGAITSALCNLRGTGAIDVTPACDIRRPLLHQRQHGRLAGRPRSTRSPTRYLRCQRSGVADRRGGRGRSRGTC